MYNRQEIFLSVWFTNLVFCTIQSVLRWTSFIQIHASPLRSPFLLDMGPLQWIILWNLLQTTLIISMYKLSRTVHKSVSADSKLFFPAHRFYLPSVTTAGNIRQLNDHSTNLSLSQPANKAKLFKGEDLFYVRKTSCILTLCVDFNMG